MKKKIIVFLIIMMLIPTYAFAIVAGESEGVGGVVVGSDNVKTGTSGGGGGGSKTTTPTTQTGKETGNINTVNGNFEGYGTQRGCAADNEVCHAIIYNGVRYYVPGSAIKTTTSSGSSGGGGGGTITPPQNKAPSTESTTTTTDYSTITTSCGDYVLAAPINNSKIFCDAKMKTEMIYYTEPVKVVDNQVCEITCGENYIFSIDPEVKVLAGTGFRYPIYVSASRTCKATFKMTSDNSTTYLEATGKSLANSSSKALSNLIQDRNTCMTYAEDNKYILKGTINMKAGSSAELEANEKFGNVEYVYEDISEPTTVVDEVTMYTPNACNINDKGVCSGDNDIVSEWISDTRLFGKFTKSHTYLKRYTGEVVNTEEVNTCDGTDKFYVSFNEKTSSEGYSLSIENANIKSNVVDKSNSEGWSKGINLNIECDYVVNNLYAISKDDANYAKYGSTGFLYRTIDVNDPFPNRSPYANWINIAVNVGKKWSLPGELHPDDKASSKSRWEISLTRSGINTVKSENEGIYYSTFDMDENGHSNFVKKYSSSTSEGISITKK